MDEKIKEELLVDIKKYKKDNYSHLDTVDILKSKVKRLEHMLFKLIKNL